LFSSLLFLIAADAAPQAVPVNLVEPNPKVMTQREIRAFNATLPKDHPFHIRCVSSIETGSLARRNFSCRTNRQWQIADDTGNQNARDTYQAMQGKAAPGGP
jgi:hypothetical protein